MRYLLATDGSESSLKAARFLNQLYRLGADDELFVIYVFPLPADPECYEGVASLPAHADDKRVIRVAQPVIATTLEALAGTEFRINEVILVGNPAQEIVEFAMNLRVDVIVAGTRGRSSAKELYLGSVSNAITHRAPCSVLIVR